MASTSQRAVRIAFGATALWIVLLQYVLLAIAREEPYPALILPGFPAHCPGCLLETGSPSNINPELIVRFTDGETEAVPMHAVLPPGPSVGLMAFSAAFKDESVKSRPEVAEWLKSRLDERFPGRSVAGLDIVWRSATYHAADAAAVEYRPLYTIGFEFGSLQ